MQFFRVGFTPHSKHKDTNNKFITMTMAAVGGNNDGEDELSSTSQPGMETTTTNPAPSSSSGGGDVTDNVGLQQQQQQLNDNGKNEHLRTVNWNGCIPISLSLAPSSLFSPTIPPPIHVLISRNTFLHVGLREAVIRLHKFAPPTFTLGFSNSPSSNQRNSRNNNNNNHKLIVEEPEETTRDDDENNIDNNDQGGGKSATTTKTAAGPGDTHSNSNRDGKQHQTALSSGQEIYPVCWFEDETSELPLRWELFAGILFDSCHHRHHEYPELPWKIRVHFNHYPTSQLLSLDDQGGGGNGGGVLIPIEKKFKHSLKQALVLQHGNNKVALNMTKQSHQQLWDAISTNKYSLYKLIRDDIQFQVNSSSSSSSSIDNIPVRVVLGNQNNKPLIQKRISTSNKEDEDKSSSTSSSSSTLTLGSLLLQWMPQYFKEVDDNKDQGKIIIPNSTNVTWRISGIVPPLSTNLVDLWQNFCHPDSFLYIILITE